MKSCSVGFQVHIFASLRTTFEARNSENIFCVCFQSAAVDAVGVICRQLPWKRYYTLLQQYLHALPKSTETHKLAVK